MNQNLNIDLNFDNNTKEPIKLNLEDTDSKLGEKLQIVLVKHQLGMDLKNLQICQVMILDLSIIIR